MCCPDCCSCGVMEFSAVLFRKRVILVFRDIIYVINIIYSWYLVICEHFWSVCGINDPRHTCDEYLVLLAKSGMTLLEEVGDHRGRLFCLSRRRLAGLEFHVPKVDIPTVDGCTMVCFESHLIAGIGLPLSKFLVAIMNFLECELVHLNPNAITALNCFIMLCECWLGIMSDTSLF
jgi:hypothetical protein